MPKVQVIFGDRKRCGCCKELRFLVDFPTNKRALSGYYCYCKICANSKNKNNYLNNREKILKRTKLYRQTEKGKEVMRSATKRSILKFPEKQFARDEVNKALKRGDLTKLECEFCGDTKTQAHHSDYSKPLEVRWVCKKHHWELHGWNVVKSNTLKPITRVLKSTNQ